MVLLVTKLSKLYSKLENHHHHHHHHHHPEAEPLAALHAFQSNVSSCITQLSSNSRNEGLEILSLEWLHKCFKVLPLINKAFAKLVVEIDYRMSEEKAEYSMEAYLKYSVDLLDFLNSISSALSGLGQIKLKLAHALSLVEASPSSAIDWLKSIEFESLGHKEFKSKERKEDEKERSSSGREEIVLRALKELRNVGLWLCSIVLAVLSGDAKVYLEMRKLSDAESSNSSMLNLDSSVSGVVIDKGCLLKEVKELKDSVSFIADEIAAENSCKDAADKMQSKLEMFEKLLDGLGKDVNHVFSEVLAGRNELINGIRFRK